MEGKDLSTYIGTVTAKPGSEAPTTNFNKWQRKGGVCLPYLPPPPASCHPPFPLQQSVGDKSLTTAFKEITNMAAKLNLPKVIVVSSWEPHSEVLSYQT